MEGKAELPGSYMARRLAAAYTIYVPLWAGSVALSANLVAAAGLFHRHGLYIGIVSVPLLLSVAAILYTALATFREARTGVPFNRFSRHVFFQTLALAGIIMLTLVWYVLFNPVLFRLGDS
jgi:hypothetical protein